MTIDQAKLKALILAHEGYRLMPYDDRTGKPVKVLPSGGKITIGIGRNLSDVGISMKVATLLLEEDIARAIIEAHEVFRDFDSWPDGPQYAVVDLIFNMGKGNEDRGFLSFKNTIKAMRRRDWESAAAGLRASLWAKQVGPNRVNSVCALLTS